MSLLVVILFEGLPALIALCILSWWVPKKIAKIQIIGASAFPKLVTVRLSLSGLFAIGTLLFYLAGKFWGPNLESFCESKDGDSSLYWFLTVITAEFWVVIAIGSISEAFPKPIKETRRMRGARWVKAMEKQE